MPSGQHEAGKHSKAGKKKAADAPRLPKKVANPRTKKTGSVPPAGTVYGGGKQKGAIRRWLGL